MGYLGRRIGLSQDKGDSTPGGADGAVGGGILDLFASGYFERQGNIYNNPGITAGLTATGGVISDYTTTPGDVYRAHIFTSSGTFDVTALGDFGDTVEYLVVAGGGGGAGSFQGGGAGAGGLRTNLSGHPLSPGNPSFTVTAGPTSYTVTIGGGGAGNVGTPSGDPGTKGQDSYFGPPSTPNGITAEGGGYAGWYSEAGGPGGSGGGGGDNSGGTLGYGKNPSTPAPLGGPISWTEGNDGGDSSPFPYPGSPNFRGSGGGGAGGSGIPGGGPAAPPTAGDGGIGSQVTIAGPPTFTGVGALNPGPGEYQWFSGGGGAGGFSAPGGTGGIGGGGNGGTGPGSPNPAGNGIPGVYGTGGGGGSSVAAPTTPYTGIGGNGGSGIVVVRYQIAELTATAKATGGAISYYNGKTIHTFTSSGTFASTGTLTNIDCLVCGGGGSSEPSSSGGGGAGGIAYYPNMPIPNPSGNINVIVGGGGVTQGATAQNGTSSTFHTTPSPYYLEGKGGGAGTIGAGADGGSGGGSGYSPTSVGGSSNQASPNPNASATNYGNAGGASTGTGAPWNYSAGGGGGAGGAGTAAANNQSGPGGNGIGSPTIPWMPSAVGDGGYIGGGGGGGGSVQGAAGGTGGTGGGGDGFGNPLVPTPAQPYTATDGLENTGGGAGGTAGPLRTKGGSGIVIIAYPS